MNFKDQLRSRVRGAVGLSANQWENSTRDSRDVELVLSSLLNTPGFLCSLHFPVQFVEFVRGCIEDRSPHRLRELKTESQTPDSAAKRFAMLKGELLRSLPPIEFSVARDIALVADRYRSLTNAFEMHNWSGDRGLHFTCSSTHGSKGRLLFNMVRILRSERCLELGTAYGMSSLFILAALKMYVPSGSLATLEGWAETASISFPILKQHYGDIVSCHVGDTRTDLPKLAQLIGPIDFLFHDCGHSRDDYINDFNNVVNHLAPGSVVLLDDIRWSDALLCNQDPQTYAGWTAVASHPRVRQAVEIDDSFGLLLLS